MLGGRDTSSAPIVIYLPIMTRTISLLLFALLFQSAAPKAGPWKSLFDGKSMSAWRIFKTDNAPKMCETPGAKDCWEIVNGVLQKDGHANDIASKEQFGDFEFELEWKIGDASNSGVFYRGTDEFNQIYWSAPEYQLLDNVNAADNKKDNHLAGSVYDLYAAPKDAARPANEWNQTRIVAKGNHVEHWLNGKKAVEYDLGSEALKTLVAGSKFKDMPRFAREPEGYIALQHHDGGDVWFRNVRVRALGTPAHAAAAPAAGKSAAGGGEWICVCTYLGSLSSVGWEAGPKPVCVVGAGWHRGAN